MMTLQMRFQLLTLPRAAAEIAKTFPLRYRGVAHTGRAATDHLPAAAVHLIYRGAAFLASPVRRERHAPAETGVLRYRGIPH